MVFLEPTPIGSLVAGILFIKKFEFEEHKN